MDNDLSEREFIYLSDWMIKNGVHKADLKEEDMIINDVLSDAYNCKKKLFESEGQKKLRPIPTNITPKKKKRK